MYSGCSSHVVQGAHSLLLSFQKSRPPRDGKHMLALWPFNLNERGPSPLISNSAHVRTEFQTSLAEGASTHGFH